MKAPPRARSPANLAGLGARACGLCPGARQPNGSNTVVVVLSEFGRTFRENGDRGTDHGHGSVYWVLGGAINGGRIAGEQQRLERATCFRTATTRCSTTIARYWAACSARCGG